MTRNDIHEWFHENARSWDYEIWDLNHPSAPLPSSQNQDGIWINVKVGNGSFDVSGQPVAAGSYGANAFIPEHQHNHFERADFFDALETIKNLLNQYDNADKVPHLIKEFP